MPDIDRILSESQPHYDLLAEVTGALYAPGQLKDTFWRLTTTAVAALPACDSASVTVTNGAVVSTIVATSELSSTGDRFQYEEQQGPCLDAVTDERWVYTPDVKSDERWPRFSRRLSGELEVHSMFSVRLGVQAAPERHLGGLNMYSQSRDSFDPQQRDLAMLLAAVGSVAAHAARVEEELTEALRTRQIIGEAIGIMRAQTHLSSDDAFAALSKASQRSNVKLRDLAAKIAKAPGTGAAAAGYDPETENEARGPRTR